MRVLIFFAQAHAEFRLPELESIIQLEDLSVTFDRSTYSDNSPFLVVEACQRDVDILSQRSILIKWMVELWGDAPTYAELLPTVREVVSHKAHDIEDKTWKFVVDSFGRSVDVAYQRKTINQFSFMKLNKPVKLDNPEMVYVVQEDYGYFADRPDAPDMSELRHIYMGVLLATGNRSIVQRYDVKKRRYLGTTTMDAELSLVMANQALAAPGKIVLDPFAGTGSFLLTCAHFGAFTFGSDIDGRQMRGTTRLTQGRASIRDNVKQYELGTRVLDCITCDIAHHPWRDVEWIDAIVTDPPYGVRAGAKKIGVSEDQPVAPDTVNRLNRVPNMVPYDMVQVITDLVAFAVRFLRPGGRLVYWLPTVPDEFEFEDLPRHPLMRIVANSEQKFNLWSRRLITMEKIASINDTATAESALEVSEKMPAHSGFRKKYFNKFEKPNEQ